MSNRVPLRFARRLTILLTVLIALPSIGCAQDPHPAKAPYADLESWPATAPGEVTLQQFQPFRAVYDRSYTQASGPGKGEPRQDRVIVHAEEIGWDGTPAIAISVLDSGAAEHADTNARASWQVVAREDLQVLFEIGPLPGTAKDYYLGRFTDTEMLMSAVDTEAQTLQPRKAPKNQPGFGPGTWVMASMELEPGRKIHLAPYYSPQANPISQASYGRVVDRKTVDDSAGQSHAVWVVETPAWYGPKSPKVLHLHVKPEPPYLIGTEIVNHDTGERKRFVWLRQAHVTP